MKKYLKNIFIVSFALVEAFLAPSTLALSELGISSLAPLHVLASFNQEINYQGKLMSTTTAAVSDGVYHMRFKLYATSSGGSPVWSEDRSTDLGDRITVSNGLFSAMLGSSTPFTGVDFNQTLYLGVEIGGSSGVASWDGEMTPRKILGAVPAAFVADTLDNLDSTEFVRSNSTSTIATSSAQTVLTINQTGAGNLLDVKASGVSQLLVGPTGLTITNGTSTNSFATTASSTNLFTTNFKTGNITISGQTFTTLLGSGLLNSGGALTLDRTGAWTGTFDGQDGTYYLDRTNHTGTQLASTISDFSTTVNSYIDASTTIPKTYTSNLFTGANIFDLITRSTTTAATTTNLFSTTASSTNLFSTNANIGNLIVGSCTGCSSGSSASSTLLGDNNTFTGTNTFGNLTFSNATGTTIFNTTASSTNLFSTSANLGLLTYGNATGTTIFNTTASSTNLFSSNFNTGTITASGAINGQTISSAANFTGTLTATGGLTSLSNLLLSGSTTLQNLTFVNATGTSATTTNLFSTTASSTNLFSTNITTGTLNIGARAIQNTSNSFDFANSLIIDPASQETVIKSKFTNRSLTLQGGSSNQIILGTPNSATNKISFLINAVEAMRIDASSNVGIGTSSPLARLDIIGANNGTIPLLQLASVASFATTTRFSISNAGDMFVSGSSTLQNFTFINATGTSATSTSLFSTVASSTNLFSTNANIGNLIVGSCTGCSSGSAASSTLLSDNNTFTGVNSFTGNTLLANATSTNLFSTTASSTNLFSTTLNTGLITSGNINGQTISSAANFTGTLTATGGLTTLSNLLVSGSSTLQNFTFVNATGTSATTTNFFSTTASSTNLFSSLLNVGANALTVNAAGAVGIGISNPSSIFEVYNADWATNRVRNSTHVGTFAADNFLGGITLLSDTASPLIIGTNGIERMRILSTGEIGIGNSAPSDKLNIQGIVSAQGFYATSTTASSTFPNLFSTNSTSTNATTTNFFSTTASSTNLFSTNANIGNLIVGSCTGCSSGSSASSTLLSDNNTFTGTNTFGNLTYTNATGTTIFNTTASSTNLFSTSLNTGLITSGNINGQTISSVANLTGSLTVGSTLTATGGLTTLSNLLTTGSSTLQNLTFVNATGTSATTTNFFATNASTTNFFGAGLNGCTGSTFLQWSTTGRFGCATPTDNTASTTLLSDSSTFSGSNIFTKTLTSSVGTITANQPILSGTQTWNNGAVAFEGISLDVTNNASAAASTLLKLQVGGVVQFQIRSDGVAFTQSLANTDGYWQMAGTPGARGLNVGDGGYLRFSNGSHFYDTVDLGVSRNAAGVLEINNGTGGVFADLLYRNSTSTSATTTNFFSTVASSTSLFSTNANIGNLVVSSCTGCSSGSSASSTLLSDNNTFTGANIFNNITRSTTTSGTSTNFFATTASSTNLFATALNTGLITSGNINGQTISSAANFTGTLTATGGLTTLSNLLATGSSTLQNFTFVNATGTSATTTNFFSTTASSTNLFATNANLGALTASAITSGLINGQTISSAANFTGTLTATGGLTTLSNLLATGSSTLQNFTFENATGTSATTTNFFSTTASSTNLFGTNINGFNLTSCSGSNKLTWTGGLFGCSSDLTASSTLLGDNNIFTGANIFNNITRSTTTAATTTNLFSTTASSTNLFSTSLNTGLITSGNINGQTISSVASFTGTLTATGGLTTLSNLLVTGSSTLQNLTFVNATGTSATTTNFFATTASSTNLFGSVLNIGSTALVVNSNGNVGIATSTPWGDLSIELDIVDPAFVISNQGSSTPSLYVGSVNKNGFVGLGTTTVPSLARLVIDQTISSNGSQTAVAGVHEIYTFNPTADNTTQVGNRLVLQNSPGSSATNTAVAQLIRVIDNTSRSNLVRGLEVVASGGTDTYGVNTGIRGTGHTFGIQGITTGLAGGTSTPAAIYGENTGTTQGDILRLYTSTMTTATSVAQFYQESSTFSGTGLLMNFGKTGGSFTGNFVDFQVNDNTKFRVASTGTTTIGQVGQTLTAAGLLIPYGSICVDDDGNCTGTTTGKIAATGFLTGHTADLAEHFYSSDYLLPGEIVSTKGNAEVGRASVGDNLVLGVVSTKPGFELSSELSGPVGSRSYPIGLAGRVPVRLSTENGEIAVGDKIALSSISGVGMKYDPKKGGTIIGIALENFDGRKAMSIGTIEVNTQKEIVGTKCDTEVIQRDKSLSGGNGLEDKISTLPDTATIENCESIESLVSPLNSSAEVSSSSEGDQVKIGSALVFLGIERHELTVTNGNADVAQIFTGDISLENHNILNVKAIAGMGGVWSIDETGVLVVDTIKAKHGIFEEDLKVGTSDKPTGITLYDEVTGNPYCLSLRNGEMKSTPGKCVAGTVAGASTETQEDTSGNDTTSNESTPVTTPDAPSTDTTTTPPDTTSTPNIDTSNEDSTAPSDIPTSPPPDTTSTPPPGDSGGESDGEVAVQ